MSGIASESQSDMLIAPIDDSRRTEVTNHVTRWRSRVNHLFDLGLAEIPVVFDLIGRTAGMYHVRHGRRVLRFNPYLFAKYWHDNIATTVPHEVAHYAADCIYGHANIRPHGREWRQIMHALGADPSCTANFDLTGIPRRRLKQHHYYCGCDVHQLTSIRHNRIQRGVQRYLCRRCCSELVPLKP